jgi:hypothetical protein
VNSVHIPTVRIDRTFLNTLPEPGLTIVSAQESRHGNRLALTALMSGGTPRAVFSAIQVCASLN